MSKSKSIISWNIWGVKIKIPELQLRISDFTPSVNMHPGNQIIKSRQISIEGIVNL